MSGEKRTTVTIDSDMYRRLSMSEQQLRTIRQDLPELLQGVSSQTATELRRRLQPIEEQQRQFSASVENLRGEVRDFHRDVNTQLTNQQREFRQSVEQVRGEVQNLARQTSRQFEQQRREFDNKLREQRRELENRIRDVESRVEGLEEGEVRREEMAQDWLDGARLAYQKIAAHPRHLLFIPGKLDAQARAIEQAQRNLEQGAAQAALALAQGANFELADLQAELDAKEQEWSLWRAAAQSEVAKLLGLIEQNQKTAILDLEGVKLKGTFEVDYWTQGQLSALTQELKEAQKQIADEAKPLPTASLRQLLEEILPAHEKQLDDTVLRARAEILGSQLRLDMADLVVEALEENGFALEGGTYQEQDMRKGYVAKVLHLDGGEVSVCIEPVEGNPDQNTIRLQSYDADHVNPEELESRQEELRQALSERGLDVGPTQSKPRPDPVFRNLDEVGRPQPQEQPVSASR